MRLCIDTNVLFSFQKGIDLGANPLGVIDSIIRAKRARPEISILMPPAIKAEICTMFESESRDKVALFFAIVDVVSPNTSQLQVGAQVFEDFLLENRKRNLDGLKVAEDVITSLAQTTNTLPDPTNRVAFQKSLQPTKETLRNRYRNATRAGFLDSVADLHLILLAKEKDAQLVTADEGVVVWGRRFGVRELALDSFGSLIRQLL